MSPTGSPTSVLARLDEHMEGGMDDEIRDEIRDEVTDELHDGVEGEVQGDVTAPEPEMRGAPVEASGPEPLAMESTAPDIADAEGDEIAQLLAALEGADDLPLDERLQLLRDAEASIADVLEGLDGL